MMIAATTQFRNAISAAGITPPSEIVGDGELRRFPSDGKRHDDAAWYVFHEDGIPAGAFGNWRTGISQTWRADAGRKLSNAEEAKQHALMDDARRKRDSEEVRRHSLAAIAAEKLWKTSELAPADHSYLASKGINPNGATLYQGNRVIGGMNCDGALMIRMRDLGGKTWNVQFIAANGQKRFLPGGRKRGLYCGLAGESNRGILLCEGFATGSSIFEATGRSTLIAFDAGNLEHVARVLRGEYPDLAITVAADDDRETTGNPGLTKATDAARIVGGSLALPEFTLDEVEAFRAKHGKPPTDYNDMHAIRGTGAITESLVHAKLLKVVEEGSETLIAPTDFVSNGSSPTWANPKAIQAPLRPVADFDPGVLLPETLRTWVMDEADRMPCAPEFVAVGALAALGAVIGARCVIKPKAKDDWLVVPNLWGAIVGLPSAKKSPSKDAALKPVDRLVTKAREAHATELEAFETERLVYEAKTIALEDRIKGAAKDPKKGYPEAYALELQQHRRNAPPTPTLRRFTAMDTTVEKLGELLRENPAGLLVTRDELVGLLASWEREGRESERAFFLEAWNGNQRFETDRIGRGSIVIENLCVSIFGGIQPDKLTGYLEQAAHALANDGLLQRFQLLVYPDQQKWEYRDRLPDKTARERVIKIFDALADGDPVAWGAAPADEFTRFPHLRFEPPAQGIYIEWTSELNGVRLPTEEQPIIAQHLAKYDKLFPALALIFHLVECVDSGVIGAVSADAAMRAAAWCEYLESHARRCYGLLMDEGLRSAQALAAKLSAGAVEDGFTARDVRRKQWRYLTKEEAVQAALDWLEDEGWLRGVENEHQTGRPRRCYLINPLVKCRATEGSNHGELA